MKKLVMLCAILILGAGCSDGKNEATAPVSDAVEKPRIYATSYPLQYFVERIAGGVVEVHFPVAGDEDPAYWEPAPEDVVAMQEADLIVLNGASYEGWLENVSLPPSRLVDTTGGLSDRLLPLAKKTTHSHGLEGEHEHSGTAFTTWLDPTLAAAQAGAVKDALAARWPEHADRFEVQLAGLTEELSALDTAAEEAVASNPRLPVLFSHPVYQYLTQRYGLNAKSVHWEPEEMPNEAAWQELRTILGDFPAAWMIWEDTPQPQISERLESIGIRSVVFDPCANAPPRGDFLSVMEQNLETLRLVFEIFERPRAQLERGAEEVNS